MCNCGLVRCHCKISRIGEVWVSKTDTKYKILDVDDDLYAVRKVEERSIYWFSIQELVSKYEEPKTLTVWLASSFNDGGVPYVSHHRPPDKQLHWKTIKKVVLTEGEFDRD